MPRLPRRSALLIPVLGLGLLVPGFNPNFTRAEALPTPCELVAVAPDASAADDVLLLSAILPADEDLAVAAAPTRPAQRAPTLPDITLPPGRAKLPGALGVPKPPAGHLSVPDPAMLNLEPIVAARQFRESLTEKQKADLRAVLTKHEGALRQARTHLPEAPTEPRSNRPVKADREATQSQASSDVQRISDQVDQDIDVVLTPTQRELLRKARPTRLRAEVPNETSDVEVARSEPSC
ncbi:MAG: hypothetical protein AB7F89_08835 [Pirellulaceae bacterium]